MSKIQDKGDGKYDPAEYQAVVVACRAMDPADYQAISPALARGWEFVRDDMARRGITDLRPYPNSTPANCEGCGILVGIGPNQAKAMEDFKDVAIFCLVCATVAAAKMDEDKKVDQIDLFHLGNRDRG